MTNLELALTAVVAIDFVLLWCWRYDNNKLRVANETYKAILDSLPPLSADDPIEPTTFHSYDYDAQKDTQP